MRRNVKAFLANAAILAAFLWWVAPRSEARGLLPLDRLNHLDRVEAELAGKIAVLAERLADLDARVSVNADRLAAVGEELERRVIPTDRIAARIMGFRPDVDPNWAYRVAGLIHLHARDNDLDPWLVVAVIKQESNFNPGAWGRDGEVGLMQIMPYHCKPHKTTMKKLERPSENIRVGTSILSEFLRSCGDDIRCGLARYNGGGSPPQKSWAYADSVLSIYADVRE